MLNWGVMEAFMYRCHPQTRRLAELVRTGAIGEVRMIRTVFSYQGRFDPGSRTFGNALGGGGILDIGCYTASAARLIAGAARRHGVSPINIAPAWVLSQPFPVFPIIGTRLPGETRDCLRALDVALTDAEVRWLDLQED